MKNYWLKKREEKTTYTLCIDGNTEILTISGWAPDACLISASFVITGTDGPYTSSFIDFHS